MRRKRPAGPLMLCDVDLERHVRPEYPTCPRRPRGAACLQLLIAVTMAASLACWSSGAARAEDAQVLPKGVSRVTLDNLVDLPVTQRWNPHGNGEDLAGDFNNRRLDKCVWCGEPVTDPIVTAGTVVYHEFCWKRRSKVVGATDETPAPPLEEKVDRGEVTVLELDKKAGPLFGRKQQKRARRAARRPFSPSTLNFAGVDLSDLA